MNGLPGEAIPRRAILPRWLKAMVAFTLILASASVFLSVALYAQINTDRERNVVRACQETNVRHDSTVGRLDARVERALRGASKEDVARARASREFTVSLIDALAPRRDCAAAGRQVGR